MALRSVFHRDVVESVLTHESILTGDCHCLDPLKSCLHVVCLNQACILHVQQHDYGTNVKINGAGFRQHMEYHTSARCIGIVIGSVKLHVHNQ